MAATPSPEPTEQRRSKTREIVNSGTETFPFRILEHGRHYFDFDLLDPTKLIPEELVPVQRVGKLTLNRNPDNFFGETGPANYIEINGSMPIGKSKFSVGGALCHQKVKGPLDYNTWNVGFGYSLTDHVGFDLRGRRDL